VPSELSPEQTAALSQEIDAASSLMRHGLAILTEYRFAARDAEPVLACLAGGAEKLLKLTYGLMCIDDGCQWPSKAAMRNAGHRIVDLDDTVRGMIDERRGRGSAPGLITRLLDLSEGHPGINQVLATLERYAVAGRFYNLDLLAGSAQGDGSPHDLWNELEMDIVEANPEMLEMLAGEDASVARRDMNKIIVGSVSIWCELLLRSWMTGVCGRTARGWSAQLDLGHAPPPIAR